MAQTTLNIMPTSLTAGESLSVTVAIVGKTPSDGWSLQYRFAIAGISISANGVDNSEGGWTVSLDASETLPLPSGRLVFDAIATTGSEAVAVDRGEIITTASPLFVSKWAAVLEAVETAIATFGANPNQSGSVSVDGMSQSFTYHSLDQLMTLRAFCIRQRNRERGTRLPGRILSRFL